MKRGFIFILFILFCYSVSAILITPASLEMEFVPEKEYDCGFSVKANTKSNLLVYARGELNESIHLSPDKIEVLPGEWTSVGCKVKLPQDIKPGLNKNFVGVVEDVSGKGVVGGIAGVELSLFIRKPYPGKYLELEKFEANDAKVNEFVNFVMEVINRGNEKINDAFALIDIYDKETRIDQIRTNSIEIINGGTFEAKWQTSVAGRYTALAKINYDGSLLEEKKEFRVGDILIEVLEVNEAHVKKGRIAKFDVDIQSYWNEPIENVYVELDVVGSEVNSKTESISVDPWDKTTITGFLETSLLEEGEYEVNVLLKYNNKISETKTKLLVTKGIEISSILLIVGGLILILLIMINIIVFKKKWKKKN